MNLYAWPKQTGLTMRTIQLLFIAVCLALVSSAGAASAQASRSIRIIVPYPPGGTADVLARLLGRQISENAGVNIIVENRPGAGTVIATEYVFHQPADGNTVLMMSNSFVINSHMHKLNYNPLTDFAPVCNLVTSPNLIVVNATAPYKSLAEFLTAAKARPGELTIASVGPATTQHIGFEQLKLAADANITYVPFPGGAPAVNALLGGHVSAVYGNYSEVFEQIEAGKLRPLAATGGQRIHMFPELPTVAEEGFPGYDVVVWLGTVVPVGTPQAVIDQLATLFRNAMKVPAVHDKLLSLGLYAAGQCGADFAALIRARDSEYAKIIRAAGISQE
jgi:tripartite-type tricarboxylate transporter receptor subunit TctC